ncbi:MAG: homogentisate 1,2-dioxygenase [Planctomycetota bacterium]|nr:MAG: homogentisate 1,2-dioxygenase [Planctomycetota bacterium]
MIKYVSCGEIPANKHVAVEGSVKGKILREELISTRGFSGIFSTKYHVHIPSGYSNLKVLQRPLIKLNDNIPKQYYHLLTNQLQVRGNFIENRVLLFQNDDVSISTIKITENYEKLFKNASQNELYFIHKGQGLIRTDYGNLKFKEGDYVVIPKSTIYQFHFELENNLETKIFLVENNEPYMIPKRFRNEFGQLNEVAPYCERDFQVPKYDDVIMEGDAEIIVKTGEVLTSYHLNNHPFDVVGWDGYLYPFTFHIDKFKPIVGKIHLPPPVHVFLENSSSVVCNFVPRLFDWHDNAIPAPYYHSNVDSDEVIYYAKGDFMSRKGISEGSVTLHPMGLPHGPQPGKQEESIGKKETVEYAIMVDTFRSLMSSNYIKDITDQDYSNSWSV